MAPQPDRVGRLWITFSDGSKMGLYRQTVEDFCLYTGKEMDDEQLTKLKLAASKMSAKMRAVRIVSASAVSKRDLERRLVQKGEDALSAKEAVQWMADLSLVDDRQTAAQVVQRCISKGYGIARAKQALYEKQIPKAYWQEALADYPDQEEAITAYIESHLPENPDYKAVKKVIDALIRKGHSYAAVRRCMDFCGEMEDT